jgi:hypothetical protein
MPSGSQKFRCHNHTPMANFVLLDISRPEVAIVVAAMVQARDAVGRRSWSHPQESTSEGWADVLADPRIRSHSQAVTVVTSSSGVPSTGSEMNLERSSSWPAASASGREHSAAMTSQRTGPTVRCRTCSVSWLHLPAPRSGDIGIAVESTTSSQLTNVHINSPEQARLADHLGCAVLGFGLSEDRSSGRLSW